MKQDEYFKTIVVYGKMVNVGLDDAGQEFFLEYVDDRGELVEFGCGAYNLDYEGEAKALVDYRRYSIEVWGEETYLEMERAREERLKKYKGELDDTSI